MNFDLSVVPFSRFGSYFALSRLPQSDKRSEGLYVRMIRGGDEQAGVLFGITPIDPKSGETLADYRVEASPVRVRLESGAGWMEWCIPEPDCIRVRGEGIGLKLTAELSAYDYALPYRERGWELNSFSREVRILLSPLLGHFEPDVVWGGLRAKHIAFVIVPGGESQSFDLSLEEYRTVPGQRDGYSYEEAEAMAGQDWEQWLSRTIRTPEDWEEARTLAAYITWSCVVRADGYLSRPAMYMSKNWMTNIWSWDHCFNAMALAGTNPDLAWDQFAIFFDRQDESGMLPDFLNDKYALWNCCKPPIHGWTLNWMMENSSAVTDERLREIYEPLGKWTTWWFRYRDDDGDGIPQYNHGNDSGWDNSTAFLTDIPVESPDLSAFLVIQMEVLAAAAQRLGLDEESERWSARANELLQKLIGHFWDEKEGRFTAMRSGSHERSAGDSLLSFVPIVLGSRLPGPIREKVIADLKQPDRFLTGNGLATESTSSPYYAADGYWRGPIWAPSTMLIVEGLRGAGDEEFASELARKFCRMAAKSGMAENFDAVTGEGLRDRAFTWTSSVFLLLAGRCREEEMVSGASAGSPEQ
ncbi:hypothetical protein PC41400_05265 [Paenibacillus chitinolyticus]|uniref:Mannosylglycerate hydrolase MGH1-like glycoside hydrolase domain-containing protein n=1 Tax=Paenibacillus chitinolyticus TaxID=79263 RepID=A0A410WS06_9BACL|nr:trehalase family glycosidase [Paenibacillus chitinolyticus]MCY9593355.1 hypothetical protein [Paenibacillus chitinolyticus]MCY9599272.1 hypothetical protein [Paenibacillus chitinolyticus]QAV17112.1 hypothetical protein PC41400_05265 [Paenibacillus chitinolyticus]